MRKPTSPASINEAFAGILRIEKHSYCLDKVLLPIGQSVLGLAQPFADNPDAVPKSTAPAQPALPAWSGYGPQGALPPDPYAMPPTRTSDPLDMP